MARILPGWPSMNTPRAHGRATSSVSRQQLSPAGAQHGTHLDVTWGAVTAGVPCSIDEKHTQWTNPHSRPTHHHHHHGLTCPRHTSRGPRSCFQPPTCLQITSHHDYNMRIDAEYRQPSHRCINASPRPDLSRRTTDFRSATRTPIEPAYLVETARVTT